ncbi:MAG: SDR family oxidoreductase [Rhodothermales bacterium]
MKLRTISVLGCGWLGLPLAEALARTGHTVRGSTTSAEKLERLEAAGIEPHRIVLGDEVEGDDPEAFFEADVLVFCVPPSGSTASYPAVASAVRRAAERAGTGWVLMTSSTSVYPDLDGVVTESDAGAHEGVPLRRNGEDVLVAERVFYGATAFDTTILRLAGLYGYGRHPARYFAGKRDLAGGEAPVNLVHRDDVIGAVMAVLEHEARGATFNVCADHHPTRNRLYPATAERLGLEPPTFNGAEADGYKIVSSQRLRDRLDFRFAYPDPMTPAP